MKYPSIKLFFLSGVITSCHFSINTTTIVSNSVDTIKYQNSNDIKEIGEMSDGQKNGTWRTFTKEGKIDSVIYYEHNEKIALLDKEDFELIEDTNKGFSISLPRNWVVKNDYSGSLFCAVKRIGSDTLYPPTIVVSKETRPYVKDIAMYKKLMKAVLPNHDSAVFVNEFSLIINGLSAWQVQYFATYQNERLCVLTTVLQDGKQVYIITGMVGDKKWLYIRYLDVFKEITKTFKVLN